MSKPQKIAVIGGGSWATAITKMLCENVNHVAWWLRNEETIAHIKKYGHNPNYISAAELPSDKLKISNDLNAIISAADCLIFAVPSAFLKETLASVEGSLKGKLIVSAIKGIVPEDNAIVGDFFFIINITFRIQILQW